MSNGTPPVWYDPFTGFLGGGPLPFLPAPEQIPSEPFPAEQLTGTPISGVTTPSAPTGQPSGCYDLWNIDFQGTPIHVCQLAGSSPPANAIGGPVKSGVDSQSAIGWCGCLELPTSPNCPKPDICGGGQPQPIITPECKPDLKVEICNWPDSLTQISKPTLPPIKLPAPTIPAPAEQKPTVPPGQPAPINVGQASTCDQIDQWANAFTQRDPSGILQDAGIVDDAGQFAWTNLAQTTAGDIPVVGSVIEVWARIIGSLLVAPITAWVAFQSKVTSQFCDKVGALTQIAVWRSTLTWTRRLLGIETRQSETVLTNWENYLCPVNVPSVIDADIARRTGDINKDEWRCWVRLNGFDETVHERVYNSHRLQLTPQELIMLWRRKQVKDEEIGGLLAQAGMISTDDQMRLDQVTQFIPPVTDLIRFTARALGDQDLVQRFKLMEGFDELYQGKLKDWGQANGISDEVMQYYFAGTRQIPAPGQLYTMLQRLREDNVPPGIDREDWVTTTADLDRALREQHYSPFWWPRLQAISYIPLGIRQLRKPFTDGAIQAEQLLPRLKDLGYSPFDAVEYVSALEVERRDVIRKHAITKLYMDAAINRQDASQRLQEEGYQEQEVNDALDYAKQEFLDKSRQKCVEGFRKRYECGEFDSGQLQQQLSQVGLDNDQIVVLAARWDCERKSCGKQIAASQLCSWADSGLITPDEHKRRLINAGYSDMDASNIVVECNLKQEQRILSQRERAARALAQQLQKQADRKKSADRQALAAANKAARDLRTLLRQRATDEARAVRAMASATDRANRVRAAMFRTAASQAGKIRVREVMLAKATEAWALQSQLDLSQAGNQVSQALEAVHTMPGVSSDAAVRSVVMAALSAKKAGTVDLTKAAEDIAHLMLDYASVASAAVCEQSSDTCHGQTNNGSNAVPESTSELTSRPTGHPSSDTSSRIVGT